MIPLENTNLNQTMDWISAKKRTYSIEPNHRIENNTKNQIVCSQTDEKAHNPNTLDICF